MPRCSINTLSALVSCLGMMAIYGANANAMRMLLTYLDVQKVHST